MNILVIFTGGTIGSSYKDGWISPDDANRFRLIEGYEKNEGKTVDFTAVSPYTVLSENLGAAEMNMLIDCLCENIGKGFDGIIVAHGTDSLLYSAAAAAFCLGETEIPVLFVSSNKPLESDGANGALNFEAAVEFIRNKAGRGVYLSYSNDGKTAVFHRSLKALRHPECSDAVFSLDNNFYAVYDGGKVIKNTAFKSVSAGKALGKVDFTASPCIDVVTVSPVESYNRDLSATKALVLLPYHSGTLNTASERFAAFCKKAKAADVPVFVPCVDTASAYESRKAFAELGLTVLPCSSSVAVITKIWIAASLGENIADFVLSPLADEY